MNNWILRLALITIGLGLLAACTTAPTPTWVSHPGITDGSATTDVGSHDSTTNSHHTADPDSDASTTDSASRWLVSGWDIAVGPIRLAASGRCRWGCCVAYARHPHPEGRGLERPLGTSGQRCRDHDHD